MHGGEGRDYLDGGEGDDFARGGQGNDTVMEGRGNDTLGGDDGEDVLAGGHGQDFYHGGQGRDRIVHEQGEQMVRDDADRRVVVDIKRDPGRKVEVDSKDKDFHKRAQSDLDALRSVPEGRKILRRIDQKPGKVIVHRYRDEEVGSFAGRITGPTGDAHVFYEPKRTDSLDGRERNLKKQGVDLDKERRHDTQSPPVVSLGHELVHGLHTKEGNRARGRYDGTAKGARNEELRTTGLRYDHDNDPKTDPKATRDVNENELRKGLGLPPRKKYHFGEAIGDGQLPEHPGHFHK